jgi:hypothetical protein
MLHELPADDERRTPMTKPNRNILAAVPVPRSTALGS